MKKRVLILFIGCMLICAFCSCDILAQSKIISEDLKESRSDEQLIEERIVIFVDAYNNGAYEAVLECLGGETRGTIKMSDRILWNIFGILDDKYTSGFFGSLLEGLEYEDIWGYSVDVASDGDMIMVDIESIDIQNEQDAVVTATITFNLDMPIYEYDKKQEVELTQSQEAYILMVKENGDWYLQNIIEK